MLSKGLAMENEIGNAPYLRCVVEFTLFGPTEAVNNRWAAGALRVLADRFENGGFIEGFDEVRDRLGMPIGSVYFQYVR
jgi:hypothetical protein